MFDRAVFRRIRAACAVTLAGCAVFVLPSDYGLAQDSPPALRSIKPYAGTNRVPRTGGYSTTLSEVWGVPEMPPPPKDFGPHFDFPAGGSESLNGPPSRSPYPN